MAFTWHNPFLFNLKAKKVPVNPIVIVCPCPVAHSKEMIFVIDQISVFVYYEEVFIFLKGR
jgi:hypothetical protein